MSWPDTWKMSILTFGASLMLIATETYGDTQSCCPEAEVAAPNYIECGV